MKKLLFACMALALSFGLTACHDDDNNAVAEQHPELADLCSNANWFNGGASPFALKVSNWEGQAALNIDIYKLEDPRCYFYIYDPNHSRNAELLSVKDEGDDEEDYDEIIHNGFRYGFEGKVQSYDPNTGVLKVLFHRSFQGYSIPCDFKFTTDGKQMRVTANVETILRDLCRVPESIQLLSDKMVTFAVVDKVMPDL